MPENPKIRRKIAHFHLARNNKLAWWCLSDTSKYTGSVCILVILCNYDRYFFHEIILLWKILLQEVRHIHNFTLEGNWNQTANVEKCLKWFAKLAYSTVTPQKTFELLETLGILFYVVINHLPCLVGISSQKFVHEGLKKFRIPISRSSCDILIPKSDQFYSIPYWTISQNFYHHPRVLFLESRIANGEWFLPEYILKRNCRKSSHSGREPFHEFRISSTYLCTSIQVSVQLGNWSSLIHF